MISVAVTVITSLKLADQYSNWSCTCRFLNRVWRAIGSAICSAFQRLLLATLVKLVGADPAQVASLASSSFVSSRATGSTTVSTLFENSVTVPEIL